MDSLPPRTRGGGLLDSLYKVVMRRNSVYVTFIIAGAFLGERAVDYGVHKIWDHNNVGNSRTGQCNKSLQGEATAIEELKDLDTMEVEELQHSLEAHEMRINKRRSTQEQALQARSNYNGKGERPWKKEQVEH
ncbi:hypothetical protein CR513_09172, partial [Mucuna pruriens]